MYKDWPTFPRCSFNKAQMYDTKKYSKTTVNNKGAKETARAGAYNEST